MTTMIPIILDVLLGVLLVAALMLGMRLEKRLKSLRDSHAGFAQAVGDLDRAAARAEQGLADLRAATDEAAEVLAARIEKAQILSGRLENLAERAAAVPPPQTVRSTPAQPPLRPTPVREPSFLRGAPVATPRSRARVDEDLFADDGAPRQRSATGSR